MELEDSVKSIKGIGDKTASCFARLSVYTLQDLLSFYPRAYETFEAPVTVREAMHRDQASVLACLIQPPVTRYVKGLQITEGLLQDQAGTLLKAVWFNMPFLSKSLKPGTIYVFRGKLNGTGSIRRLQKPKVYKPEAYEELEKTLQPVYPLTRGLTVKTIQDAVKKVLDAGLMLPESLDPALLKEYDLEPLMEAVKEIHFPKSRETFLPARRRLVFEEFYRFILEIRKMKEHTLEEPNHFPIQRKQETQEFINRLPYSLTGAQMRVLEEIRQDLAGSVVMNRLIQGDVGSGKTIVAFLSMYEAALNGYESALMAPTEVLAIQHEANLRKLSEEYGLGLRFALLTGAQTAAEKKKLYAAIASHQVDIVIGTQALIQDKVHYQDLALVITDEQHRFGVNQRKILSEKGRTPHVLVMSATPIPRTLGMILYGDLSISVMDELPKNRLPIKNCVVDTDYRGKAYSFIRKQAEEGHQAYVICPMVEDSETMEGENVLNYAKSLQSVFPPFIRVAALHGRMKNEEKEAIMASFARNEIQVLVSTTVIEVGIDVPNATVMMVENAERFGLAQLHQLRGRVGRGKDQSYCIFVDTTGSEESQKRLEILNKSNDGFYIASEDLKMRGPGDFFGMRQSGSISFKLADIYTDAGLLKLAEKAALKTLNKDAQKTERAVL